MIAELSHFALVLALATAVVQAVAGLLLLRDGVQHDPIRRQAASTVARRAAGVQAGLIAAAFLGLIYLFLTSDFSVITVMENSHSAKPLLYKIAGSWGNHEGSMLLWILYGLLQAL